MAMRQRRNMNNDVRLEEIEHTLIVGQMSDPVSILLPVTGRVLPLRSYIDNTGN